MILFLSLLIGMLFAGAIFLLLRPGMVRVMLGLVLLLHASSLLLFAMGELRRGAAPVITEYLTTEETLLQAARQADPLPQALVITILVIGAGILMLTTVLAYRTAQAVGSDDMDDVTTTDELESCAGHNP